LAETVPGLSLVALLVAAMGLMGGIAHGGQQLGCVVKPPPGCRAGRVAGGARPPGAVPLPDVRLGLLLFAWLMSRSGSQSGGATSPALLTRLTWLSGPLLVVIYMGRLARR